MLRLSGSCRRLQRDGLRPRRLRRQHVLNRHKPLIESGEGCVVARARRCFASARSPRRLYLPGRATKPDDMYTKRILASPTVSGIWSELAPRPGRVQDTIRITVTALLVTVVMLTFRMPYLFAGPYLTFMKTRQRNDDEPVMTEHLSKYPKLMPGPQTRLRLDREVPVVLGLEQLGKATGRLISGASSGPPASTKATRTFGSWLRRAASTHPAEPAPTTM
jgi:hypothetical protein